MMLRPADYYARAQGVKAILYGAPGHGKTPLLTTVENAALLLTEPGSKSLAGSQMPTAPGFSVEEIEAFVKWAKGSAEAKKYDAFLIDSISELAEIYVKWAQKKYSHGQKAFGAANEKVLEILDTFYFMPNKHVIFTAKEGRSYDGDAQVRHPWFPGKELGIKFPHRVDFILHLGIYSIPNVGPTLAIRTANGDGVMARARSVKLQTFEPPDLGALIRKEIS